MAVPDLVGQGRVELPTSRLSGVRSNHLSYWPRVAALVDISVPRHVLAAAGVSTHGCAPRSLETESYAFKTNSPERTWSISKPKWALTLVACASLSCPEGRGVPKDWMRRAP